MNAPKLTQASVKSELNQLGLGLTKRDGEYRVFLANPKPGEGYFTDDLADALATGRAMAQERDAKASNPEHVAYDYDAQKWVTGPEAIALRRKQLTADLALLNGPKGADYIRFTGNKCTLAEAIARVNAEIAKLPVETAADLAANREAARVALVSAAAPVAEPAPVAAEPAALSFTDCVEQLAHVGVIAVNTVGSEIWVRLPGTLGRHVNGTRNALLVGLGLAKERDDRSQPAPVAAPVPAPLKVEAPSAIVTSAGVSYIGLPVRLAAGFSSYDLWGAFADTVSEQAGEGHLVSSETYEHDGKAIELRTFDLVISNRHSDGDMPAGAWIIRYTLDDINGTAIQTVWLAAKVSR